MTNQTDLDNADAIVTITMTETAAGDETDGQDDDDQRWAEAVIASLPSRSRGARKALAEALLDGETTVTSVGHVSGLEQNPRKSARNPASKSIRQPENSTPHVSGTTSSKTAELSRFPTRSLHDCDTRTPRAMLGQSCSTPSNDSESRATDRHTKVYGVKLCFIPVTS
jgi:hypothetical protein